MAFLNPWFLLGGALAIGIPIVIHLLNQRHFDRVIWAAMRFLQISTDQNRRRIRLEDLLLLLLRISLVVLLGLILARPALRSAEAVGWFGSSRVSAVILLDNSYSMCQTDGVTSRFDRAKHAALDVLDTFPAGSNVSVFLVSDIADPLIAEPTFDLNLARQSIQNAKLCDRGTNLLPGIQQAVDQLLHGKQEESGRREIYLLTDGQASGFRQIDDITRILGDAREVIQTHIILAGAPETQNLALASLRMDASIPVVGVPQSFFVDVTNFGQNEATGTRISLRVDNDEPCDDAVIELIPPGQTRSVVLSATLRSDGYHTVTASLPPDHVPADDTRTIALRAIKSVSVLLVDGSVGLRPQDSETYYLRQALVPVPPDLADNYFLKCTSITPPELASHKFADFDVVALANVTDLEDAQVAALADFVHHGGGLLIFPGPNINPDFYNQKLLTQQDLLPATLGAMNGSDDPDKFLTFQSRNLQHPIVSLWNDPANGDLSRIHVAHWFSLAMLPGSRVVALLSDGSPAITERRAGQGCTVLFATSARTEWNNLAVASAGGLWVPLINRTIGWMIQRRDVGLNIPVGAPIIFHPPPATLNLSATITPPGGNPDSVTISQDSQNLPTLYYPDTSHAGEYDASIGDQSLKFAAQSDPRESNLEEISDQTRSALEDVADVGAAGSSLRDRIDRGRIGTELWFPLTLLLLVAAVSETFLSQWFSRSK